VAQLAINTEHPDTHRFQRGALQLRVESGVDLKAFPSRRDVRQLILELGFHHIDVIWRVDKLPGAWR